MGSKFERFYWREIELETARLFAGWVAEKARGPLFGSRRRYEPQWERFEEEARELVREQAARKPKYDLSKTALPDFLRELNIRSVDVTDVEWTLFDGRRAGVRDGDEFVRVEEFGARRYRREGNAVLQLESRPWHVIFGALMAPLIQDPADPHQRRSGFGARRPGTGGGSGLIWTNLPEDFGARGYAARRADAIRSYLSELPGETPALLAHFEDGLRSSENLRQYLWAHEGSDIANARAAISAVGAAAVVHCLAYLVDDYWGHYLGWPDLLVHRPGAFKFVEIKFSHDQLRDEQRRWIRDNATTLRFPFELLKIHRGRRSVPNPQ